MGPIWIAIQSLRDVVSSYQARRNTFALYDQRSRSLFLSVLHFHDIKYSSNRQAAFNYKIIVYWLIYVFFVPYVLANAIQSFHQSLRRLMSIMKYK